MADRGTWELTVGATALVTYADVMTGFTSGGGPLMQVEALLDATVPVRFDRKNTIVELSFTLTKEHADNAASASFFVLAPITYGGIHDVTLTHKSHAGAETDWTIDNAEVEIKVQDPIGVTTISQVTIRGYPELDVA
jgi:hypothetical protein